MQYLRKLNIHHIHFKWTHRLLFYLVWYHNEMHYKFFSIFKEEHYIFPHIIKSTRSKYMNNSNMSNIHVQCIFEIYNLSTSVNVKCITGSFLYLKRNILFSPHKSTRSKYMNNLNASNIQCIFEIYNLSTSVNVWIENSFCISFILKTCHLMLHNYRISISNYFRAKRIIQGKRKTNAKYAFTLNTVQV